MNKAQLKQSLLFHHSNFTQRIESIHDRDLYVSMDGKWNAAQQLEHIVKSVAPVRLAFLFPVAFLKLIFGTSNRPSRTYEGLVEKYHSKLSAGGKSSSWFIPSPGAADVKAKGARLRFLVESLIDNIDTFSEKQLDYLLMPHPLLGKLTLREMLYFTIYHVQHHQKQIRV